MNFEVNMKREYLLAGDISGSMNQSDPKCDGLTRYNFMLEKFKQFIKIACDFDTHEGGVTVFLFGKEVQKFEHTTLDVLEKKLVNFEFEGMTNTDLLIDEAFEEHKEERAKLKAEGKFHPGTCLMIFTDGEPTNMPATERSILNIVNNIDSKDEFDIVFLTVGSMSPNVDTFLRKLILMGNTAKYNIVSVRELQGVNFISAATE